MLLFRLKVTSRKLMIFLFSITEAVFFHWLNLAALMILLLILSRILLLILPISDLVGLISRQVGLLAKFGLWSLRVMNASLLAVLSTLSSIPSFVVMFLLSAFQVQPMEKHRLRNRVVQIHKKQATPKFYLL